jgi:hypothetical protein
MSTPEKKPPTDPKGVLQQLDNRLVYIAWSILSWAPEADAWALALKALDLPEDFVTTRHQLALDHLAQLANDPVVGDRCAICYMEGD